MIFTVVAIWKYLSVSPSSIQLSRRFDLATLHNYHLRDTVLVLECEIWVPPCVTFLLLLFPWSFRSLSFAFHRYASAYARWNRLIAHIKSKSMHRALSISDFILLVIISRSSILPIPITDDALYCPIVLLDFRRWLGSVYPSYWLYSLITVKNDFPQFCRKYEKRISVSIIMSQFWTASAFIEWIFHRLYSYDVINFNWLSREWTVPAFRFYENVVLRDISVQCFINFISLRITRHVRI